MGVPDWIVTLFDFNVQNADINSQLQDERTDMRVELKAQSLFWEPGLTQKPAWQFHVNTAVKYLQLCAAIEPF